MADADRNENLMVEIATALLETEFAAQSFERLLCRPKEAMLFCRRVRERLPQSAMTDERILWTLLNRRKQGRLARREASRGR